MKYLYTLNIYENGLPIHKMQLLSIGNYKMLNTLLCDLTSIVEGEYKVNNGKKLVASIDAELMEKYIEDEVKVATCEDGKVVATHPMSNLTGTLNKLLMNVIKKDEEDEEGSLLLLSTAVSDLVYGHDLFTNFVLTDVFATLNCVNEITGEIYEGFDITVEVKEYDKD